MDGKVQGVIAVEDEIRPESKEAIDTLHALGVRVAMITGDSQAVADSVARRLGIDDVAAQVQPADKADAVKRFQQGGRKVAMVGDGVNDAPALATADVGIAVGAGTDVAVESAGIVLVRSDPRDVVGAIELSRATYSKMIQNLVWATGYNLVAIPVAKRLDPSSSLPVPSSCGASRCAATRPVRNSGPRPPDKERPLSGSRPERVLDPVCETTVDVAEAEEAGLTLAHEGKTYAFCRPACLWAFEEEPATYAANAERAHAIAVPQSGGLPMIDEGMRRWYESCSCSLLDAHPDIKAALDVERATAAGAPVGAGVYEVARSPGGRHTMTEQRTIAPTEGPVWGMSVDPAEAREKGLTVTHEGTEYAFCGKGCLLESRDEPSKYLGASYLPSME